MAVKKMHSHNPQHGISALAAVLTTHILIWCHAALAQMAPHCSSTFNVWQPGQEAQQMIRDVYFKVDNLTSYTKYQVSELKAHLAQEVSRIQNWTFAVDKRVFQIQIDKMDDELLQMKYTAGSSKTQMQLEHVNRRVDDLERSMFSVRSKLRSGRSSGGKTNDDNGHKQFDQLPQHQGVSGDTTLMLKNSVGDLKAEWILLKRDVEALKKEAFSLSQMQHELRNDSSSLKMYLELTSAETKELENKVSQIAEQQNRLEAKLEKAMSNTEEVTLVLDRYKEQVTQYGTSVANLQSKSSTLQNDLNDVHVKLAHINDGTPRQLDHTIPEKTKVDNSRSENILSLHESSNGHSNEQPREETEQSGIPIDCHEVYQAGHRVSSVYHILPRKSRYMIPVYCEMVNHTGYTIIQRRLDGTINFNRRWSEYKQGFGNPYGELWAGNNLIHLLTQQKHYTLRIDLWDWEGEQYYAEYSSFHVEGEEDQYKLLIGEYTGNVGDSFSYHNKMAFSTEDVDNDLHERHCASENKGGWWFNSCFYSHLNGIYHTAWYAQSQSNYADGIVWFTLKDSEFYSLRKVEMKLRPNKATG